MPTSFQRPRCQRQLVARRLRWPAVVLAASAPAASLWHQAAPLFAEPHAAKPTEVPDRADSRGSSWNSFDSPSASSSRSRHLAEQGPALSRRDWLLGLSAATAASAPMWSMPSSAEAVTDPTVWFKYEDEDLTRAMLAVKKLGESSTAADRKAAEDELTKQLKSSLAEGAIDYEKVAAAFTTRASSKLRLGKAEAALDDLASAMKAVQQMSNSQLELSEVPAQVYAVRGEVMVAKQDWKGALSDYNKAADMLEELGPLEDFDLLKKRGKVEHRLGLYEQSAEDFRLAQENMKRAGKRAEAFLAGEKSAIVLVGAGDAYVEDASDKLVKVIRGAIGMISNDVAALQRVVLADSDARMAMAAISWRQNQPQAAEAYWRDACARIAKLADDAMGEKLALGFPNGVTYQCDRYVTDTKWLVEDRLWPDVLVQWFQTFLKERTGEDPPENYIMDLSIGKRPGEGSTLAERMRLRGYVL